MNYKVSVSSLVVMWWQYDLDTVNIQYTEYGIQYTVYGIRIAVDKLQMVPDGILFYFNIFCVHQASLIYFDHVSCIVCHNKLY